MNKLVLGFAIAGALGITGCSDSPQEPVFPDGTAGSGGVGGVALTKAVYAPGDGNIPVPNDLLFAERDGIEDLTLDFPAEDYSDFSDPSVSMGSLDGWSATAPFKFDFSNSDGVDISPSSVIPGSTVRMYQVNVARPEAIPGTGVVVPTGPVTGVAEELTAGIDFVALYSGPQTVAVVPLRPLTQQASYMVVVTDGIMDANGNAVIADGQYQVAKREEPIPAGLPTSALEPVRQLVNAMENAAEAAGQAKENIVMSFQFTVQSIDDVVAANKQLYIDLPLLMGATPHTAFSSLFTDTTPFTGLGAADLYKGEFGLSYFMTAPSAENPTGPISNFFTGIAEIPTEAGPVANPFAGGVTTYANPLVAATGSEIVPLMVSMPKVAFGCAKPEDGYPVMIFQHGITSNRTTMVAIADAMGAPPTCSAVVAMDMPIHGIDDNNAVHLGLQAASGGAIGVFEGYAPGGLRERTFGIDYLDNVTGAPGPDGTPDSSGAHTINLTNLLASRDNNRQAILDLLALEKAIPFMDIDGDDEPDFDQANIYYMGHSLGGIVGAGFLGHADYVKAAVLANPGSGLALMLDASPTFGPRIRAGLAAAGVEAGTPDYAQFLFATQTVVDSMDPASTSALAVVNNIPTLMIQAADDEVIPNLVAGAPQSGTTPMAAFLGLTDVTASEPGLVPGSRLFSKFNVGVHATVLSPFDAEGAPTYLPVTTEMQTQIVSFLSSGGQAVLVSDPSLLAQ